MHFRIFAISLALALVMAHSALALPCTLKASDWASLAHPSCRAKPCGPITQADADALPAAKQHELCKGRKYYHFVHEHLARGEDAETIARLPQGRDFPSGLSRYVTEDEYMEMSEVLAAALADMFKGKLAP